MSEQQWWGELPLRPGAMVQIGPSRLWFRRKPSELQIAIHTLPDPISSGQERVLDVDEPEPPEGFSLHRFAAPTDGAPFILSPLLADRAVVARPTHPFAVPPGSAVTVFISTALWIELSLNGPLVALPLYRMSETWFGRSTIEGELCYAMRTALRMDLENVPRRPHRAITTVHINNRGPDSLPIHRIRLPVQHLSLFSDAAGELWTEALEMTRQDAGDAILSLSGGSPAVAGPTVLLSPSRAPREDSRFLLKITSFLP
ncbi:MAG: hypothetical protein ACI8RZ_002782 [Myxococcota bacterium]|jgi:hypothetical protein